MKNLKLLPNIFVLIFILSCTNKTKINSLDITDKGERIETLKKEIKINSGIENAEFDLFNVNGFSDDFISLPGSSSCNYKFVVRVKPKDVSQWTKNLSVINGEVNSEQWMLKLIQKRKNEWITCSKPIFYSREGESGIKIIVYEKEGIIYKSIFED